MRSVPRVLWQRISLLIVLASPAAWAFDFVPTESEWMAWPDFCKARYVDNLSVDETLRSQVPPEVTASVKQNLGACYNAVHHYCAGVYRLSRAFSLTAEAKAFGLHQAAAEHYYVRENCPRAEQFWSTNETQLALVQVAMGKESQAISTLDAARKAHPEYSGTYLVGARILAKSNKNAKARALLLEGEEKAQGSAAEIQYALGLSYYRTKEFDKARDHARRAYASGYPLPWLRDRLAEKGYPL